MAWAPGSDACFTVRMATNPVLWRPPKALVLSLLALALSGIAQAKVYRCVDADGTLIFSDRPCGAQAEVHESGSNFSVVPGVGDHEQRLAEQRAWIDQQRELRHRQRRQREAAAARAPSVDQGLAAARPVIQWVQFWAPHPAPAAGPGPPESRPARAVQGFSALSGRQLGATRRDGDQEGNQ